VNKEYSFGYPIFILDDTLQQGNSLPKWDPHI